MPRRRRREDHNLRRPKSPPSRRKGYEQRRGHAGCIGTGLRLASTALGGSMWIIGLLLGLVIGAAFNGFEGAILGALVGWAAGYGFGQLIRSHDAKVKDGGVESRLAAVEDALRALDTRLSALEGGVSAPPAMASLAVDTAPPPAQPAAHMPPPVETLTGRPAQTGISVPGPIEAPSDGVTAGAPPPAPPRPAPAAPREPPFVWRWLMGGNTLVRAGVVVLFFGVAFLLKYAYEHTHVPIELRLMGVALGAVALLGIGWRLRLKRPGYALALQGGGVGVLYLT